MKNHQYYYLVGAAATALFLIVGLLTNAWDKAWLVYLVCPVIYWGMAMQRKKVDK